MKKQTLGIDLDSTLNNLDEVWLKLYNHDYNDNLTDWNNWNINEIVKRECGEKIFDYLRIPGFFYSLDIRPNAISVIDKLIEKFDIYIVTAYIPETCVDKTNWIKKYLPKIKPENIIFCNNKGLLNLDYLIDDGPHNIECFKQKGILYNMPYNSYLGDKYTRVNNWLEIEDLLINE